VSPDAFALGPLPPPIDPALLADLARVETATVGHFRHDGFMHPDLRPLLGDRRIAGTAVTVAIPGPDSALLHHAMGLVRPGDMLVVDRCGDDRHACWGGFMATAAKAAGLAGAIIDGRITDPAEVRANGVPVWSRGVSPITTKLLALGGRLNVPVSCGGIVVRPGDAVLADECGVLVLAPSEVRAVADRALAMQDEEAGELAQLRAGVKVPALTGASDKINAAMARES
jgi:regulator of RNase E activity RraA